ncbi:PadR family transcriptional regulator [Streptomyces mirabilis]|uniref:PadR family transcriptional regulator n=1 Tax=Streptomyces mirabilis TaxID=68239 RepID=UPI0033BFA916
MCRDTSVVTAGSTQGNQAAERSCNRPPNRPPWAHPQPDFGPTGRQGPVSDGSLYLAISRLTGAGLLERRTEPGDHEITDFTCFFTVLAFLSRLPDEADQHAVLRRRLAFLEEPASFFYDGDRPLHVAEVPDRNRRGILLTARATSRTERTWLHEVLGEDAPEAGAARTGNAPPTLEEPAS